jgi:hypothetical protein
VLVGIASFKSEKNALSTSDKQDIYLTSRAPLKSLFDELRPLSDRLGMIQWDYYERIQKYIKTRNEAPGKDQRNTTKCDYNSIALYTLKCIFL